MQADSLDAVALARAMAYLGALLNGHAGGVEVVGLDVGVVEVAVTRACEACPNLPITFVSTVRDTLLGVPGVTEVRSKDVHASPRTMHRIAVALGARPVLTDTRRD